MAGYFDPLAFLLVVGGGALIAAIRCTRAELYAAVAALGPACRARPETDARVALIAVARIEAIAQARGFVCADQLAPAAPFLRQATRALSDTRDAAALDRWIDEQLSARRARHAGAACAWRALADATPAMGMLGTVLGLIAMFARMDDPAHIGAPMATALLATLYGLVVANLIAGPIADRLERLSAAELAWQARVLAHLSALAHAELDHVPHALRPLVVKPLARAA